MVRATPLRGEVNRELWGETANRPRWRTSDYTRRPAAVRLGNLSPAIKAATRNAPASEVRVSSMQCCWYMRRLCHALESVSRKKLCAWGRLREQGIAAVPHGFRSSFRDWAGEETDHPREVIEAALAHVVRNRVEAAYACLDLFERWRVLMDDWPRYLGQMPGEDREA